MPGASRGTAEPPTPGALSRRRKESMVSYSRLTPEIREPQEPRQGSAAAEPRLRLSEPQPACALPHGAPPAGAGETARRMILLIDVINKCNLRCVMCGYPTIARDPRRVIDADAFKTLAEALFPGARQVNLSCAYEPFTHKGFLDYVESAIPFAVPKLTLTTNATLLDRAKAERLVELGISNIVISIDGATEETYEAIRLRGRFKTLLQNIRHLVEVKKERGQESPRVQFNYVMLEENLHEIPQLIDLVSGLDPHKILFIHHNYVRPPEERRPRVVAALREALLMCATGGSSGRPVLFEESPNFYLSFEEILEAYGGSAELAPRLSPGCLDAWGFMRIAPEGEVMMCPHISRSAGNIFRQGMDEIWNGSVYRELRRQWNEGDPPDECRECSYSGTGLAQLRRAQDEMEKLVRWPPVP